MEELEDFKFVLSFKIKDSRVKQEISKLLRLELKNLDDLSSRIHDLSITPDCEDGLIIQLRANDLTSFKIATSSISKYIEIIGKTIELLQKKPKREGFKE
nr:hypothetical protein [Candidatus Sigynarchaeota archaeon]